MTVSIGSVILSEDLSLDGLESAPVVAHNQARTLFGASIVQVIPITGGRTLTLSGEHHFSLADLTAIRSLAANGQPVTLVHHRGTFNVLIVGIEDPTPAFDYCNPDDSDWYSATITMLEV